MHYFFFLFSNLELKFPIFHKMKIFNYRIEKKMQNKRQALLLHGRVCVLIENYRMCVWHTVCVAWRLLKSILYSISHNWADLKLSINLNFCRQTKCGLKEELNKFRLFKCHLMSHFVWCLLICVCDRKQVQNTHTSSLFSTVLMIHHSK